MRAPSFGSPVNPAWFAAAIQALIVLDQSGDEVCPSGAIADQLRAHAVFLRRVLATLVRAGIVEAREGREGGYRLARPASAITLADVYRAIKSAAPDDLAPAPDLSRGPMLPAGTLLALAAVLDETEECILAILARHSVAELAARADTLGGVDAHPSPV